MTIVKTEFRDFQLSPIVKKKRKESSQNGLSEIKYKGKVEFRGVTATGESDKWRTCKVKCKFYPSIRELTDINLHYVNVSLDQDYLEDLCKEITNATENYISKTFWPFSIN